MIVALYYVTLEGRGGRGLDYNCLQEVDGKQVKYIVGYLAEDWGKICQHNGTRGGEVLTEFFILLCHDDSY